MLLGCVLAVCFWCTASSNGTLPHGIQQCLPDGTHQWHPAMAPSSGTLPHGTQQWHPASSNGTHHGIQQWHLIMAPYHGTQQWHHIQPVKVCHNHPLPIASSSGSQQWHLTMASSKSTVPWHRAMAPYHGIQQ